eukprot:6331118-Pyramimonas_sp.AAC.1
MFRADGMCVPAMSNDADSSCLEFDASEAYPQFLEFYEDVHEEMSQFGRVKNFKVRSVKNFKVGSMLLAHATLHRYQYAAVYDGEPDGFAGVLQCITTAAGKRLCPIRVCTATALANVKSACPRVNLCAFMISCLNLRRQ